jgi:hypothetical protein
VRTEAGCTLENATVAIGDWPLTALAGILSEWSAAGSKGGGGATVAFPPEQRHRRGRPPRSSPRTPLRVLVSAVARPEFVHTSHECVVSRGRKRALTESHR